MKYPRKPKHPHKRKYASLRPAHGFLWDKPVPVTTNDDLDFDDDDELELFVDNAKPVAPGIPARSPFYWRVKIRKKYDPARHWKNFESEATCHRKKVRRINQLRRIASRNPEAQQLLATLEGCRKNHRCGSMACPICMRRFRRWQVSEALYTLRKEKRSTYRFITLILHAYVMKYGFHPLKVNSFKQGLMDRLHAKLPKGACLIGWIETHWEPDMGGFMPHFHGIVAGATYEELRRLKPVHNVPEGKRPLVIKRIKKGDELAVATYCVKQFPRRPTARQKKGAKGKSYGSSTSIELQRLIGLSKLQPEKLLVLSGVRREKNGRRLRRTK